MSKKPKCPDIHEISPWHKSNDHRSIFFINQSSEWVVLEGKLNRGKDKLGRQMTSTAKIPPGSTYCHLFLGEYLLTYIG